MEYEDELDAARDVVRRLGGAKKVGPQIWPDKTPDGAARYLLDCLNASRAERMSPSQLLLLMRMGCAAGHHELMSHLLREAGYQDPIPRDPRSEAAQLASRLEGVIGEASALAQQLQRLKEQGL